MECIAFPVFLEHNKLASLCLPSLRYVFGCYILSISNILLDRQITPLYISAREGHLSVVKYLLEKGGELNKGNKSGVTPLWVASMWGYLEIMEYLLENGANVNAKNDRGETPLWAAIENNRGASVVKCLLSNGAKLK